MVRMVRMVRLVRMAQPDHRGHQDHRVTPRCRALPTANFPTLYGIFVNDGKHSVTEAPVPGTVPVPIDVSQYFVGGYGDIKYSVMVVADANTIPDAFTATYKDGIITLAVQKDFAIPASDTAVEAHNDYYNEALVFKVTAKDGNLFSKTTEEITVRGNKNPDVVDAFNGLDNLTVGTQDAFASNASDEEKMDPCNKLNTVCVEVQGAFSDNGHDAENLAAGFAKLTYHSTSKAGVLEAMTTADAMLKLVGHWEACKRCWRVFT